MPTPEELAAEEFDTGLRLEDLDPERPRPVETPWGTMALYLVDGEPLCSQAFCPHLAGPLFQGTLSGATITCPWHQWRYDLRTGRCLQKHGPAPDPGGDELARCDVRLSDAATLVLRPARPPR